MLDSVRGAARSLPPLLVAGVAGAAILVLVGLGSIDVLTNDLPAWGLNEEGNPPAVFSSVLLWIAATACLLAGTAPSARRRAAWLAFGAFLLYFGFDELLELHERLGDLTGLESQVALAPITLIAFVALVVLIRGAERPSWQLALLVAGAAAWVAAQAIEYPQFQDDRLVLPYWTIVPEELLEMTGTLCFLLAGLVELRSVTAAPAAGR